MKRTTRTLLACAAIACGGSLSPAQSAAVEITAHEVANLTYQLSCLSLRDVCSADAYREYWKKQDWTDADDQALKIWAGVFEKYQSAQIEDAAEGQEGLSIPTGFRGFEAARKLEIVMLTAESYDDLAKNLELVVTLDDRTKLLEVINRFRPRFTRYWQAQAGQAKKSVEIVSEAFAKHDLLGFAVRVAKFFNVKNVESRPPVFHLILRPKSMSHNTFGHQVERHGVLEVADGIDPIEQIGVVMHELFHSYYAWSDFATFRQAMRVWSDGPDGSTVAAILNESFATAFGNGLVERRVLGEEGFQRSMREPLKMYNDAGIDRAAKALVPVLAKALKRGLTIANTDLNREISRTVREALADRISTPKERLRQMRVMAGTSARGLIPTLSRALRAGSVWSSTPLDDVRTWQRLTTFPGLNGVVLMLASDFDEARRGIGDKVGIASLKKLKSKSLETGSAAFLVKRQGSSSGGGYLYMLMGEDEAKLKSAIERFAELKEIPEKEAVAL